jgi:cellulose synthase/poly-beta-1,6-N-acetylglucosamine synthase-like glycosyltransferase
VDKSVSVVLNGFRRGGNLREQVAALRAQSVVPLEILVWFNNPGDGSHLGFDLGEGVDVVYSSRNFGVWSRFFFALNARGSFVCVFDDDTIPGRRWLENCLRTMESHEGLLGTIGLRYDNPPPPELAVYGGYRRFGWSKGFSNDDVLLDNEVVEVDFVGHSWFFRREWLEFFVRDLPDFGRFSLCGEDMHFSFMLQKYAGIRTFVPPHPRGDMELWGSVKGREYGDSPESLWLSNPSDFRARMSEFFRLQRLAGWRLIGDAR